MGRAAGPGIKRRQGQRIRHALRPYQVEAGRAILDSAMRRLGLTITIEIARQGGKNELSAQVELLLLASHMLWDVQAVKCAPTFRPQALISLRRLWSRIQDVGLAPVASKEEGHIVRLGRAAQVFLSAEPEANVVGHTAHLLLEVDEAQGVDAEKFNRDFRPMAAAANATTVYYGTPWDGASLLEEMKERSLALERRDGLRRHFRYDWEEVARYNPAYGRYVEQERQRLGESHPLFLTQYCLQPLSTKGRLLTTAQRALLAGSHSRRAEPQPGEVYVAGLDLAGEEQFSEGSGGRSRDATVLTIARALFPPRSNLRPIGPGIHNNPRPIGPGIQQGPLQEPLLEVVEHQAFVGELHDELLRRLSGLLRLWGVRRVAVDATGLGEPLARFLAGALGDDLVIPYRFTAESKSRLGYGLLAAINSGRLRMYIQDGSPEYREFWRQVERARAEYRPNRTMSFFVAPAEGHDDYLMSLALAVVAAQDARPRTARGRLREE